MLLKMTTGPTRFGVSVKVIVLYKNGPLNLVCLGLALGLFYDSMLPMMCRLWFSLVITNNKI